MGSVDWGHLFFFLISENPRSKFIFELMLLLCWFCQLNLIQFAWSLRFFTCLMMDLTILVFFLDFFWFSCLLDTIKILDDPVIGLAVLSGLARILTHPSRRLANLASSVHWCLSDDCSCSRTNAWQFPTYPRHTIPAFLPFGTKATRVWNNDWNIHSNNHE